MRVMFAVSSWPGHYYPMVPLGWALQAAGHDVRVACAPSQTDSVSRAGLTPVPILDGMDLVFLTRLRYLMDAREGNWPYPWRPLHPVTGEEVSDLDEFSMEQYISDNTASTFGALVRSFAATAKFAKSWPPDIVVHDPLSTEGQLAAAVAGVPSVTHLWGPTGTHEPPSSGIQIVPEYPPGTFARWKVKELGLKQVRHVIDPCPRALAPPAGTANRLPVRYLPYNGPGAAADWALKRPAKPRVCVVWGTSTSAMSGPRSFILPDVVHALAGLDAEIVVTATGADLERVGELPDGVRGAERIPLNQLLPTCSAVVHHGGAGCVMTALDAGVPQLALTFAIEQALNGERIATAGAGAHLPGHLAEPSAVRAAVTDLLDKPSYAEAASQLQESSQLRPAPAKLVGYLTDLAAGDA
jgi:UDP:flavonoid glycosyltransferase YjiC (YdhE family)